VTPEERAKKIIQGLGFPREDSPFTTLLREAIACEVREAEQAMSKYWEMTVGQERDELRERVAMMERALCAWNDDFKSSDKNVISVPRRQIENLLQGKPHNEGN
jgi:hypothetical protein